MTADESRPGEGAAPESADHAAINDTSAFTAPPCPDCGQPDCRHDATCPLMLAVDRAAADDAAWFAARPGETERHREVTAAEATEQELMHGQRPSMVAVIQLRPGVRSRFFIGMADEDGSP